MQIILGREGTGGGWKFDKISLGHAGNQLFFVPAYTDRRAILEPEFYFQFCISRLKIVLTYFVVSNQFRCEAKRINQHGGESKPKKSSGRVSERSGGLGNKIEPYTRSWREKSSRDKRPLKLEGKAGISFHWD